MLYAILREKLAFEVLHNCYFNNSRKTGANIPFDLRVEHLNRLLKLVLKQLKLNISKAGVQRIPKSLSTLEDILCTIDKDSDLNTQSEFHN